MKYYHKYKEALEAKGYRVDEHGYVWDSMGNQSAGEDNYGNVQSKDPNVNAICEEADIVATQPKKAKKAVVPKGKKRARTLKSLNIESGLGACSKFKFVCSQETSCQGWDCKDQHMDEEQYYDEQRHEGS